MIPLEEGKSRRDTVLLFAAAAVHPFGERSFVFTPCYRRTPRMGPICVSPLLLCVEFFWREPAADVTQTVVVGCVLHYRIHIGHRRNGVVVVVVVGVKTGAVLSNKWRRE